MTTDGRQFDRLNHKNKLIDPLCSVEGMSLLADLPKPARKNISNKFTWWEFDAGSQIISRGEIGNEVFFLVSGAVQIVNFSESGRVVAYAMLQSGNFFGELAAIDGKPRSAAVVAMTRCVLGILAGREFLKLITQHEKSALVLLRRLAEIIRGADERIENLSLFGAEQRVCLELLRYLEPDPGDIRRFRVFPVPTQAALANSIGVTRQTVARIFGKLSRDQIIERRGKALYIRNHRKLEETALETKPT